jgi:rare lipoprotein A
VSVTNKSNGRTVVVRINDRGPFVRGRVIDLTPAAAQALGFSGLARVTLNAG